MSKYGSLNSLARASLEELQTVKGIGPDKAVTLVAAFALARKMVEELRDEAPLLDHLARGIKPADALEPGLVEVLLGRLEVLLEGVHGLLLSLGCCY